MKWTDLPRVLEEGRRLGGWLMAEPKPPVGSGFVYRLLAYADMLTGFREGQGEGLSVLALLAYDFERNLPKDGPAREWVERLRTGAWKAATGAGSGDETPALQLRAIASYALNLYRRGERHAE
jgi:hypothetical protein